jgi:hypothetical protein
MSYLHYVCLFAYSGVQHILCGVFVSGRVKPAIEGVSITVTTVGAESEYVSIETDKKGEFK